MRREPDELEKAKIAEEIRKLKIKEWLFMADKPNSTIEEKKKKLIENGKKEGFVSYEQLANEFKGMEIDSDTLNDLYDALMANNIEVISETA